MTSESTAVPLFLPRLDGGAVGSGPSKRWPGYKNGVLANPLYGPSLGFCTLWVGLENERVERDDHIVHACRRPRKIGWERAQGSTYRVST